MLVESYRIHLIWNIPCPVFLGNHLVILSQLYVLVQNILDSLSLKNQNTPDCQPHALTHKENLVHDCPESQK